MNLRHLRIFQAVATQGSVTEAATTLFISQPAVSAAIAELEAHLGVQLFDRIGRRIHLNETGKRFLGRVHQLLELYDQLDTDILSLEETSPIRIGSSITLASFVLAKAIDSFRKTYPDTPTPVRVANAERIEQLLINHEIDLGLIEGVLQNSSLTHRTLSVYRMVLIGPPRGQPSLGLEELVAQPWLLREKGSAIRDILDSSLLLHGIRIEPEWTSINSQVLIRAVKQGLGYSVLPRVLVETELAEGEIIEVSVPGLEMENENHLVYHPGKLASPTYRRLIESIETVAGTITS